MMKGESNAKVYSSYAPDVSTELTAKRMPVTEATNRTATGQSGKQKMDSADRSDQRKQLVTACRSL